MRCCRRRRQSSCWAHRSCSLESVPKSPKPWSGWVPTSAESSPAAIWKTASCTQATGINGTVVVGCAATQQHARTHWSQLGATPCGADTSDPYGLGLELRLVLSMHEYFQCIKVNWFLEEGDNVRRLFLVVKAA